MRHYPAEWMRGMSLGESIACELRLQIVSGMLKPGEVISENKAAADFGISRSPVRDALKALSGEGLIRLERMGAVVIGLGTQDLEELYDVRHLIEDFAQRRLAGRDNGDLLARLRRTIDNLELSAKHRDVEAFARFDFHFHEAIVLEAGHQRIRHLWNSFAPIVLTVMLLTTEEVFGGGEPRIRKTVDKHRLLADALESRDESRISRTVRDYFEDSKITLHSRLV